MTGRLAHVLGANSYVRHCLEMSDYPWSLYCVILIGQSASLLAFLLGGNSLLGHCLEYLEVWKRIHCLSIENETKMKVKWRYHSP